MKEDKENFKSFSKLALGLKLHIASFLPVHKLFSLMRIPSFYKNESLWGVLLTKAFLINEEEEKSVIKGDSFALSKFARQEFEALKNIKKESWTKIKTWEEVKKLFEKIQPLDSQNYQECLFSRQETKFLESLLDRNFALSNFTREEFKKLANIEEKSWKEIENFEEKLFKKIQSFQPKEMEQVYKACHFSSEETKFLQLLLNKMDLEQLSSKLVLDEMKLKLSVKLLNKPKEIFQEKIKALKESIKESINKIKGNNNDDNNIIDENNEENDNDNDEKLIKSITRFLVTGELQEGDDFLTSDSSFLLIYDIALAHKTLASLKILDVKYLSKPECQGEYVARWLLENLDFPFRRDTDKRTETSDKELYTKMLPRSKLNFQEKDNGKAIFSVYDSKKENLTAKGLKEDQCKMQVLNFINNSLLVSPRVCSSG